VGDEEEEEVVARGRLGGLALGIWLGDIGR